MTCPDKESTHGDVHFDMALVIRWDTSWNNPINFGALNKHPPLLISIIILEEPIIRILLKFCIRLYYYKLGNVCIFAYSKRFCQIG